MDIENIERKGWIWHKHSVGCQSQINAYLDHPIELESEAGALSIAYTTHGTGRWQAVEQTTQF